MENLEVLSIDDANMLVIENQSWAENIAKSVARSWSLDWKSDGLDGAAMEALIFCSRRFKPGLGIPFKGYARKRIHEAAVEAAKKSKGWRKPVSDIEKQAKEVSVQLLNIFPEIREGALPFTRDDSEGETRSAIRSLLTGAAIIAAKEDENTTSPDDATDYKKMIMTMASLEPIHQQLLWLIYWEGISLRGVATQWETDELNVIREHQVLLEYLQKRLMKGKKENLPKVRPGLRTVALKMKHNKEKPCFSNIVQRL